MRQGGAPFRCSPCSRNFRNPLTTETQSATKVKSPSEKGGGKRKLCKSTGLNRRNGGSEVCWRICRSHAPPNQTVGQNQNGGRVAFLLRPTSLGALRGICSRLEAAAELPMSAIRVDISSLVAIVYVWRWMSRQMVFLVVVSEVVCVSASPFKRHLRLTSLTEIFPSFSGDELQQAVRVSRSGATSNQIRNGIVACGRFHDQATRLQEEDKPRGCLSRLAKGRTGWACGLIAA
ncbi:hypothetical protein J3F83DRAFT_708341 [Trichoderma novae-zelandiae]